MLEIPVQKSDFYFLWLVVRKSRDLRRRSTFLHFFLHAQHRTCLQYSAILWSITLGTV